jgi:glucan endo-1,3-alpha-glucosidase
MLQRRELDKVSVISAWLDLMQIYISEFKTGQPRVISSDRIFLWARLYPAEAEANDRVGKPANWQWVSSFSVVVCWTRSHRYAS